LAPTVVDMLMLGQWLRYNSSTMQDIAWAIATCGKKVKLMKNTIKFSAAALLATTLFASGAAVADSGPYFGGSIGNTMLEANISDPDLGDFTFDENDFSWKLFGGYTFDLGVIDLGVEAGYVDLGGPSMTILAEEFGLDVTAWDAFAVAGFDLGPIGVFAKLGMISWDADVTFAGIDVGTEDGSDTAYGVGAAFNLGSFQIRAEYEVFDISDVEDLTMLSAGFVFTF